MKALLIEVDFDTGRRAGDIDPHDPNLQCYAWQSLPQHSGKDVEIRLVEDNRDLSQYEDVEGVTILNGKAEINQKIDEIAQSRESFIIEDETVFRTYILSKGIDMDDYPEDKQEMLKMMYLDGVKGIKKTSKDVKRL